MQLKFIDLKNGDIDAIYCKIEKEINIIYDKYSFIINNILFKELVLKTIKALRKLDIEDDVNVYSKIEEYLVTKLDDIVKEQIETNIIDIFNKFIEVKLLGTNNSYNALMELEKLSFFSSYNINFSFDDSIELINNNNKLNSLLELVVFNNKKVLSVNGPEAISSTEIVTCLIDSYCVINQYEEEIEEVETTRNFDDNVKLYLKDISRYKLLSLEEEEFWLTEF